MQRTTTDAHATPCLPAKTMRAILRWIATQERAVRATQHGIDRIKDRMI